MNFDNLSGVLFIYLVLGLPIMTIVGVILIPRFYSNEKYKNIFRALRWFFIIVLIPLSFYITGSLLSLFNQLSLILALQCHQDCFDECL